MTRRFICLYCHASVDLIAGQRVKGSRELATSLPIWYLGFAQFNSSPVSAPALLLIPTVWDGGPPCVCQPDPLHPECAADTL
jgi:hypothetical protein